MELYDCKETEDRLKDYLGLNEKYEMSNDDHFMKIISQTGCGIRLLRQNKVETLFAFICSSNNNIKVTMMQKYLTCVEFKSRALGAKNPETLNYYKCPYPHFREYHPW